MLWLLGFQNHVAANINCGQMIGECLSPIKKVAVFLMMIGMEKGRSIIEFMDNGEIKVVVSEIQKLTTVSQDMQKMYGRSLKRQVMKNYETGRSANDYSHFI